MGVAFASGHEREVKINAFSTFNFQFSIRSVYFVNDINHWTLTIPLQINVNLSLTNLNFCDQ